MGLATLHFFLDVVSDDGETSQAFNRTVRWVPALDGGKREIVSLPGSAFTALTVPSGAKAVLIVLEAAAVSLTLKGLTADTGTTIAPASNPINGPTFLFLGATPSIGILNGSATTRTALVVWL